MKKFFVLFCIPASSMEQWMKEGDEATKKEEMETMMKEWDDWMSAHTSQIVDKGLPLGKTKRVDANGVTDVKNDLTWYIVLEAESPEAAAEIMKGHPNNRIIPTSYIDIMGTAGPAPE